MFASLSPVAIFRPDVTPDNLQADAAMLQVLRKTHQNQYVPNSTETRLLNWFYDMKYFRYSDAAFLGVFALFSAVRSFGDPPSSFRKWWKPLVATAARRRLLPIYFGLLAADKVTSQTLVMSASEDTLKALSLMDTQLGRDSSTALAQLRARRGNSSRGLLLDLLGATSPEGAGFRNSGPSVTGSPSDLHAHDMGLTSPSDKQQALGNDDDEDDDDDADDENLSYAETIAMAGRAAIRRLCLVDTWTSVFHGTVFGVDVDDVVVTALGTPSLPPSMAVSSSDRAAAGPKRSPPPPTMAASIRKRHIVASIHITTRVFSWHPMHWTIEAASRSKSRIQLADDAAIGSKVNRQPPSSATASVRHRSASESDRDATVVQLTLALPHVKRHDPFLDESVTGTSGQNAMGLASRSALARWWWTACLYGYFRFQRLPPPDGGATNSIRKKNRKS